MRRLIILCGVLLLSLLVTGTLWATEGFTFVEEEETETVPLVAPAKRIDKIYKQGDKTIIIYPNIHLIPVGEGDSMLPMVTGEHLILITKDFTFDDIQVGDFVVVDNKVGRYFHQVVEVREDTIITRGINNHSDDLLPVSENEIVGIAIAVVW